MFPDVFQHDCAEAYAQLCTYLIGRTRCASTPPIDNNPVNFCDIVLGLFRW